MPPRARAVVDRYRGLLACTFIPCSGHSSSSSWGFALLRPTVAGPQQEPQGWGWARRVSSGSSMHAMMTLVTHGCLVQAHRPPRATPPFIDSGPNLLINSFFLYMSLRRKKNAPAAGFAIWRTRGFSRVAGFPGHGRVTGLAGLARPQRARPGNKRPGHADDE